MGFGQGLSGLNAAAQTLDVIGNNIANSGTAGFKGATTKFADIYATSRVGLGVQTTAITQRFTVGNVETTGNQYDIAIDGSTGFFRLTDPSGEVIYSRNGQFHKDKDHYIVNAQGQQLTGYPAGAVGADPVPLRVPVGNVAPEATTSINAVLNLNAQVTAIDPATTPFDPEQPTSFHTAVPTTVFDSLGNSHQLTQYFVKRPPAAGATTSTWEVHVYLDNTEMTGSPANLQFTDAGLLQPLNTSLALGPDVPANDAPTEPLEIEIDFTGSTQFGSPFTQNIVPDGYASGEFASVSFAEDGTIMASYTNGQTEDIGTVVLANFNNVQGLQPVGGNGWTQSPTSGPAILGAPGTNGMSRIMGQAIEQSNVDLSAELVNLIIAQRTYQANAQTISTQDQILQTLMQMR